MKVHPTSLGNFLDLYPRSVRTSLRRGSWGAVTCALLDFVSLLVLLPVFTQLTSGPGASGLSTPVSQLLPLSVQSYVIIAMVCMITRSIAAYVVRYYWLRCVASADVSLSQRLLGAYVYAPYEFHLNNNSAELMSRAVSNVNAATYSGLGGVLSIITDITSVLALAAALLAASPIPGMIVFAYLGVIAGFFVGLSRKYTLRYSRLYARRVTEVYRRTATVLRGVRELTVAGAQQPVLDSIRGARSEMSRAQRNIALLSDVPRLTLETALYAAILGSLLFVVNSSNPNRALPVVALYVVAGLRVLPAISRVLGTMTQIRSGVEIGTEIGVELARIEIYRQPVLADEQLPSRATLELDGVTFGYTGGPPVIDDVSLRIEPGQFVGVVGPSGGGKSTLLALILGLLMPRSGKISYGGVVIGSAQAPWLAKIGYVPQESYMLDDTILANVTLGQASGDRERAMFALRQAGLADVIANQSDGLDSPVGENGSKLSVGQRQRLGLARALYRRPEILLLDEPTASLDQATEKHVVATIEALRADLTILMVTHRREPLRNADVVYAVSGGRLTNERSGVGR